MWWIRKYLDSFLKIEDLVLGFPNKLELPCCCRYTYGEQVAHVCTYFTRHSNRKVQVEGVVNLDPTQPSSIHHPPGYCNLHSFQVGVEIFSISRGEENPGNTVEHSLLEVLEKILHQCVPHTAVHSVRDT